MESNLHYISKLLLKQTSLILILGDDIDWNSYYQRYIVGEQRMQILVYGYMTNDFLSFSTSLSYQVFYPQIWNTNDIYQPVSVSFLLSTNKHGFVNNFTNNLFTVYKLIPNCYPLIEINTSVT